MLFDSCRGGWNGEAGPELRRADLNRIKSVVTPCAMGSSRSSHACFHMGLSECVTCIPFILYNKEPDQSVSVMAIMTT